ncbi:Dihydroxyacetone kinase [Termitomyces sp. T112]|nr:Dihydroxyacetone kinase [Termitomyces sp. T112]KAH0581985.1 hypothetical protein H2248_011648 [Termitomyces sp. 'cryptogamus']
MHKLHTSARLRNKTTSSAVTQDSPPNSASTSSQDAKHKRRKIVGMPNTKGKGKLRARGIQGKLKLITEMPLDILLEIFSFLQPADLLHLSRANKALRGILLDRKTNCIWKGAFMNIEQEPPPEIPEDMTYPDYTLLLYGTECSYCGKATSKVHWAARVRLCNDCIKIKTVSALRSGCHEKLPKSMCPSWSVSTPTKYHATLYMKEDYQRIAHNLNRLADDKDLLNTFVQTQMKFYYERVKHAKQCEKWVYDMKTRRENEIRDIRSKRKEAICQRLYQEGWNLELDYLSIRGMSDMPGIDTAQELTEKTWCKIHPRIITFLEGIRVKRLEEQRERLVQKRMTLLLPLYKEYLGTLQHSYRAPGFPDICAEEPFRSLIFSTPIDTTLTLADFAAWKDDIPRACKARAESQVQVLEALLPPDFPCLDLAMALFCCRWCTKSIPYPDVLQHHCLITSQHDFKPSGDNVELYKFALGYDYRGSQDEAGHALSFQRPWNFGGAQVKYDTQAASSAKEIIGLCGADPRSVSKQTMDELDVRVECLRCGQGKRGRTGRLTMTWSKAITHESEKHYEDKEDLEWDGPRWKLLDAEDLRLAKSKELRGLQYPVRIPRRPQHS